MKRRDLLKGAAAVALAPLAVGEIGPRVARRFVGVDHSAAGDHTAVYLAQLEDGVFRVEDVRRLAAACRPGNRILDGAQDLGDLIRQRES